MRLCALAAAAAFLVACGPHRGHTPPPGDSLADQHLPSEDREQKMLTVLPEDVEAVAAYQKQFGWSLMDSEPVHAESWRVLLTFERPRRP